MISGLLRAASQIRRRGAGRCAVACFWDPTLHSPLPCQRIVWRGSFKTGKPPPLSGSPCPAAGFDLRVYGGIFCAFLYGVLRMDII